MYKEVFFPSELEQTGELERHDDRYGGQIPSKKWKTEVAILKIILSLTGIQ